MNNDEIQSLLVKILISLGTGLAVKYNIDGSYVQMIASGLVGAGAGAWGIYSHWNMKKVPENATVVTPPKS